MLDFRAVLQIIDREIDQAPTTKELESIGLKLDDFFRSHADIQDAIERAGNYFTILRTNAKFISLEGEVWLLLAKILKNYPYVDELMAWGSSPGFTKKDSPISKHPHFYQAKFLIEYFENPSKVYCLSTTIEKSEKDLVDNTVKNILLQLKLAHDLVDQMSNFNDNLQFNYIGEQSVPFFKLQEDIQTWYEKASKYQEQLDKIPNVISVALWTDFLLICSNNTGQYRTNESKWDIKCSNNMEEYQNLLHNVIREAKILQLKQSSPSADSKLGRVEPIIRREVSIEQMYADWEAINEYIYINEANKKLCIRHALDLNFVYFGLTQKMIWFLKSLRKKNGIEPEKMGIYKPKTISNRVKEINNFCGGQLIYKDKVAKRWRINISLIPRKVP